MQATAKVNFHKFVANVMGKRSGGLVSQQRAQLSKDQLDLEALRSQNTEVSSILQERDLTYGSRPGGCEPRLPTGLLSLAGPGRVDTSYASFPCTKKYDQRPTAKPNQTEPFYASNVNAAEFHLTWGNLSGLA